LADFLLVAVWNDPLDCSESSGNFNFYFEVAVFVFSFRTVLASVVSAGLLATPAFAATVQRSSSSTAKHRIHKPTTRRSHKLHGQQAIDPERVTQIQQALIRQHYLPGDATGKWDDTTVAAMQKYQSDQGWQTKLMPDSRALKKLGLGPDYSNALNAKNSNFADPPRANTLSTSQNSGFATASGVSQ
jgi:peptidoglycan hydrolase-like protein with peptidoglycan-binding domain